MLILLILMALGCAGLFQLPWWSICLGAVALATHVIAADRRGLLRFLAVPAQPFDAALVLPWPHAALVMATAASAAALAFSAGIAAAWLATL